MKHNPRLRVGADCSVENVGDDDRNLLPRTFHELCETACADPFGAIEMRDVNVPSVGVIRAWIDFKKDPNNLAPVRALFLRVEQTQIELEMRLVVVG